MDYLDRVPQEPPSDYQWKAIAFINENRLTGEASQAVLDFAVWLDYGRDKEEAPDQIPF